MHILNQKRQKCLNNWFRFTISFAFFLKGFHGYFPQKRVKTLDSMATLYVTGFGVFEGVEDNPTQRIIENLRSDDDLGFSLKTDVMVVSVDGVNQFHESNPIVLVIVVNLLY